jgi:hypothetical protein
MIPISRMVTLKLQIISIGMLFHPQENFMFQQAANVSRKYHQMKLLWNSLLRSLKEIYFQSNYMRWRTKWGPSL